MKKITRANFEGLRQRYPVLNKEEMRRYIGGNSTLYDDSDLALLTVYTLDMDMNACSAVGSDKDDEIEEDVWTLDLGISAFSAGGYGAGGYSFYGGSGGSYDGSYGYGGYGWDIDYGYLDEVVIYGHKPDNNYYSGGNGYPGWGDGYGYGDGYSYWGDSTYYTEDNQFPSQTDCVKQVICYILRQLGVSTDRVDKWLNEHGFGCGIQMKDFNTIMSAFFVGSPLSGLAACGFDQYGKDRGYWVAAAIKIPNQQDLHCVSIIKTEGTTVTYYDPQRDTYDICSSLNIVGLYRVEGSK